LNKEKISVALSKDLLQWIAKERANSRFKPSRSAFIEQILREKKAQIEAEALAELRTEF